LIGAWPAKEAVEETPDGWWELGKAARARQKVRRGRGWVVGRVSDRYPDDCVPHSFSRCNSYVVGCACDLGTKPQAEPSRRRLAITVDTIYSAAYVGLQ
jgi:hypothetical protein